MNELKEYLYRRLLHATKRYNELKEQHGEKPSETHTYYGGQSIGYWQGMVAAYENAIDHMDEEVKYEQ